jgi:hypothetical protein
MWATSVFSNVLTKVSTRQLGENSPNLVTLPAAVFLIYCLVATYFLSSKLKSCQVQSCLHTVKKLTGRPFFTDFRHLTRIVVNHTRSQSYDRELQRQRCKFLHRHG